MNSSKTRIFMPLGILAGFGMAQALMGQSAAAQTTVPAEQAAEPAASDTGVVEVIVTAERRTSTAQKTAMAITAISGEELTRQSKRDLEEIILGTPAVRIQLTGGGDGVFIRGVGTNDTGFGDPSINFNIDGVYQQDPGMITMGTFDVNRIEVLRGPQGTLYGRNATAGSLNIISNNPSLKSLAGALSVEAGNYNSLRTEGMLNLPVNDKIAVRGAFFTNQHDGYTTAHDTDDADQIGARIKLLAQLTPNATLIITGQHVEDKGHGPGNLVTDPAQPTITGTPYLDSRSDPWYDTAATAGESSGQFSLLAAQLDVAFNGAKLTTIASYTRAHRHGDNLQAINQYELTEQRGVEARLASDTDGPLSWLIGAMVLDGDYYRNNPNVNLSGYRLSQTQPLKSYGLFGQAKYDFSDSLHLTGGLRYSSDEKTQTNLYTKLTTGVDSTAPVANRTWQSTDYKLSLQKDLTARNMLYATVSTGFKSGGYQTISGINTATDVAYPSYQYLPEKLLAYEIGSKNRFLDNRLQLNLTAYYYDYKDYQVKFAVFNGADLTVRIENAGSATLQGVELEGAYKITENDQIDGYMTASRSKFGTFVYTQILPFGPVVVDHSGQATPNAPDFTARVAYQHRFDFGDEKTLTARIETVWSAGYWVTHERLVDSWQSPYDKSSATLRYADDKRGLALRAYVKNIENVAVRSGAQGAAISILAPRTYGVALEKSF